MGDHRQQHSPAPPHQTSSCPAPDGSGTRTPPTIHRSSLALCQGVHQPVVKKKEGNFKLFPLSVLHFTTQLMNTCSTPPLEVDSLSSWQRDSGVCRPGSDISHSLSRTSFSFPAGQMC